MVSFMIKRAVNATLDKYLDLSDADISGLSEIKLKDVKIKESAFVDLGLPIKCVHGKVSRYFFHTLSKIFFLSYIKILPTFVEPAL